MNVTDFTYANAWDFYDRRKKIFNYYYYEEDLVRVTRGFHEVDFRFVVIPSEPLVAGGLVPISATKEDIRAEIAIGRKDGTRIAKEWLKKNGI